MNQTNSRSLDVPIVDFHCDLLAYLAENPTADAALHPASNCSLQQLALGKVATQVFAIFVETSKDSTKKAANQLAQWKSMLQAHSNRLAPFCASPRDSGPLRALLAIENASGIAEENEPLACVFQRLEQILATAGPILYVSLTWNDENRFGGGCHTKIGLKEEGKAFLDYLAEKNIAIDLSHASDQLATDILEAIEKYNWALVPIASHSNFRAVHPAVRNVPDAIAREIIKKKGIIGINFVRHFLGKSCESILDHVRHGVALGGEKALCFGADFFGGISVTMPSYAEPFFYRQLSNAAHYAYCIELLSKEFSAQQVEQIAYLNGRAFIASMKNC